MSLLVYATAAALALAAPPEPPAEPKIPPATIDESLEITGDSIAAELGSRMYIDVQVNDRGPYRFLVDSGADRSVIGAGLAERLALPADDVVMLRSMAGTSEARTVRIDSLRLGTTEVNAITAPALPERHLGAQGLIGIDALADQRILLDFDARNVIIQDSRQPQAKAAGDEIVVTARRRKGQLILTQVSIGGGSSTYAVIDTGSEISVGNSALLRRLYGKRKVAGLRTITLTSVTGATLEAQVAVLPELRIGGILINNAVIAFTDAPPFALFGLDRQPALLLGTDLLKSFRRLSLDFRQRKVRFTLRR